MQRASHRGGRKLKAHVVGVVDLRRLVGIVIAVKPRLVVMVKLGLAIVIIVRWRVSGTLCRSHLHVGTHQGLDFGDHLRNRLRGAGH
jgi:hypothetical protein